MNKSRIIFCMSIFALALAGCNQASPKKHVHKFSDEWESDETYHWHPATCGHNVKSGEAEHTPGDPVRENEQAATCTEDGSYQEVVYCSVCHRELSRTDRTESATGHNWSTPTYVWNDENTQCTASRYCLNDQTHVESETVDSVKTTITELDCEIDGSYDFTATFTNSAFAEQTKHVDIPATGHNWQDIVYIWNDDNSICTAVKGCANNPDHDIKEVVTTTYVQTTAPGEETPGEGTYTATFNNEIFSQQTKTVSIPATGTVSKINFTLVNNEYYKVSCKNTYISGIVVIPAIYEGKPVKEIESYGFQSCFSVNKFVISEGVETIGDYAFSQCIEDYAILPNSLKYIGALAFAPRNWSMAYSNLHFKTSGNGRYLGNDDNPYLMLHSATGTSITELEIHEDCKFIYSEALKGCTSITSIHLPDGMIGLGSGAFEQCSNLADINLPDSLEYMQNSPLIGTNIKNVVVPAKITQTKSILSSVPNLETVAFTGNVTALGDYTFYNCTSLKSVTGIDQVTSIGSQCFYQCTALEDFDLPASLTSIGNYAFQYSGIKSIVIPSGVTSIPSSCFADCLNLNSLTIPQSVTSFSSLIFSRSTLLTSITYLGTIDQWNSISKLTHWDGYSSVTEIKCTDGTINL